MRHQGQGPEVLGLVKLKSRPQLCTEQDFFESFKMCFTLVYGGWGKGMCVPQKHGESGQLWWLVLPSFHVSSGACSQGIRLIASALDL